MILHYQDKTWVDISTLSDKLKKELKMSIPKIERDFNEYFNTSDHRELESETYVDFDLWLDGHDIKALIKLLEEITQDNAPHIVAQDFPEREYQERIYSLECAIFALEENVEKLNNQYARIKSNPITALLWGMIVEK